jgi:hypothetical protein
MGLSALLPLMKLENGKANQMTDKPQPPTAPERGWLLEKMHEGGIWYITVDQVLTWTTDPLKALRLARREDANMLAEIVDDCEKVSEHQWG